MKPDFKNKILAIWIVAHLVYITAINLTNCYNTYYKYHYNKSGNIPFLTSVLNTPLANYYGKYTGAETGYGFFGFNVRSNGLFVAECNGRKLTPRFNNSESSLRFFALSSSLTDELLKKVTEKNKPADKLNLVDKYYDLAIKNVAITLFEDYECQDTSMEISYNILNYPTLNEFRKNRRGEYKLSKLKNLKISR